MKTKEFIEKVEALGYEVKKSYNEIWIKNKSSIVLAYIKNNEIFSADTAHTAGFKDLSDDEKTALMSVLYDFIATDPKEREEEKWYRLRIVANLGFMNDQRFLNLNIEREDYFICSARQSEWVKTIFTESEIAEMDITGFQKVEVTE